MNKQILLNKTDEIKPVHEYTFDNDPLYKVIDTGSNPTTGSSFRTEANYRPGYNGIGQSYYFDGGDQMHFVNAIMPTGAQSIRFQFKKDASTVKGTSETILSPYSPKDPVIYIGVIGKSEINQDNSINEVIPGSLRFLQVNNEVTNFEIQTPESLCDGQWHDILYTWDGTTNTNSVKLYVDDMTTPCVQSSATSVDSKNKRNFFLAFTHNYNNNHVNLEGYLDNLQIYDLVITERNTSSLTLNATGGDSKVDLTWNILSDATSYILKRSTVEGGPYETIVDVSNNAYSDNDVTNENVYYYIVTAIVDGIESIISNEATATPTTELNPDQSPSNKALLVITMASGERKEYDMTMKQIENFIEWYHSMAALDPIYVIEKNYNLATFNSRRDYILFNHISCFEVNEYSE